MGDGRFSERERSELWFEEEGEIGVRVIGIGRVEGEIGRDDKRRGVG